LDTWSPSARAVTFCFECASNSKKRDADVHCTTSAAVLEEVIQMDISMMIRWIVVFLIIFLLLMALVFSFFRKKTA